MRFVYPRLRYGTAHLLVRDIAADYTEHGLSALDKRVTFSHAKAEPVPTGGRVASEERIRSVRETVLRAIYPWRQHGSVSRSDAGSFDLILGKALHEALSIIPSDAAHEETWNFLSLVVMPDVVVLRYPDMHRDRMLGTPRNPLRAAWIRRETLGDLTDRYDRPLGVDEMVGLFERSDMARNRALVRALARAVMEYNGKASRSDWARAMVKEIRYTTGPRILDLLSEDALLQLIRTHPMSR